MNLLDAFNEMEDIEVARNLLKALDMSFEVIEEYATALEDLTNERPSRQFVISGQQFAYAARARLLED